MASLLAPALGRTGPRDRNRRDGALKGVAVRLCFLAIQETSRGRYQGAPFGVPPPSFLVEGGSLNPPFTRRDLRAAMTLSRSEAMFQRAMTAAAFGAIMPRNRRRTHHAAMPIHRCCPIGIADHPG